ncbi:MAG: WG repeat-containing protein [Bacteroidetes bacterium]|nr:MAG: WG repeat-containing protein [Bacteroidota bacterium]
MTAWLKTNFNRYPFLAIALVCLSAPYVSAQAPKDPVPTRKADKWTYSGIGGDYEEARPFQAIEQTKTIKTLIKGKDNKPILGIKTKKNLEKDTTITEEIGWLAAVQKGEKWGYIGKDGKLVVQPNYNIAYEYKHNFAVVAKGLATADGLENEFGVLDKTGKEIVPCKYDEMGAEVRDSIVTVAKIDKATGKALFGFLHVSGKLIADFKYDEVRDFSNGMGAFAKSGKWGFIDKTGKEVIPAQFEKTFDFSEDLAYTYKSLKWGFINKAGKEVIQYQYQSQPIAVGMFMNGLAKVRKNQLEGWIDRNNNRRINFSYPTARDFSERRCAVKTGAKWGFIDLTGKLTIPATYDDALDFRNDLAAVKVGMKWGFIDKTGAMKIPAKYDEIKASFARGIAEVRIGEEYYYIDKTGKEYK